MFVKNKSVFFATIAGAMLALFAVKLEAQVSFDATMAAAWDLQTNKTLRGNALAMSGEVELVVHGIIDNYDRAGEIKQVLFCKATAANLRDWQSVTVGLPNGTLGIWTADVLGLLYKTRMSVPIDLDDTDLKRLASPKEDVRGRTAARRAVCTLWKSRNISSEWQVFEMFPPEMSGQLLCAVCDVSFKPTKTVTSPTPSSESYGAALFAIMRAEVFNRSREAKLLVQDYNTWTNMQTTMVYFPESGSPPVQINTGFHTWIEADIPFLQSMLDNQYYGSYAQNILTSAFGASH